MLNSTCTCASAHHAPLSALSGLSEPSLSPQSPSPERMGRRQQVEDISAKLCSVRDYLHLLSDCGCANKDNSTDIGTESLAVALSCQCEELDAACQMMDALYLLALSLDGEKLQADAIEGQGNEVWKVRHMLSAIYDAFGHKTLSRHSVRTSALIGVFERLADHLNAVSQFVLSLAFIPQPMAAPTAPPAGATPSSAKPVASARTKRTQAAEAVCA